MQSHALQSLRALALATALFGLQAAHAADYVLIVNKDNANAVDHEFVAKVYKGEAKTWKDGNPVNAYDLPDESAARAAFLSAVVGKNPGQMRALWAGLTFSGKALPPKAVAGDAEVIAAVAANKNAIGYVSAAPANAAVKVVGK